nr:SH3 domain-containing protein [Falsochrobactrum sp. TDYN1]
MLPVGTRIDVGGCRRNWCQVSDRTYRGWVSARYVRMGGAASWPGLCPAAFSQGHY